MIYYATLEVAVEADSLDEATEIVNAFIGYNDEVAVIDIENIYPEGEEES